MLERIGGRAQGALCAPYRGGSGNLDDNRRGRAGPTPRRAARESARAETLERLHALAQEMDVPLLLSETGFLGFTEGWALYAEKLGAEMGVYHTPYQQFGRLTYEMWRACRLVVDTGLHFKRWSREQAIQWFATTNGSGDKEVRGEVDRYCAWPGQACGYKVGHSEINRLRARAQQALGPRYDFRRFNDAVVTTGGVPMVVLARRIDAFIRQQQET